MKTLFLTINIILSAVIVVLILIQGKGAGLGSAWGGGGELYQTRRGLEKFTFRLTVLLVAVFLVISVINLFLK